MSESDDGLVPSDTSLDDEAKRYLAQIRPVDIVVGIPSHRNGRTIGEVVKAVVQGLEQFPHRRILLMNADGGSSDNTTHYISEAQVPANVTKLVTIYAGPRGKGTAIRAILEAGALVGAQTCAVFEARVPGITPEWLPALVGPILSGEKDIAMACYQRSAYDRALSDNLVYPLMRVLLGSDLREPLAGEFAVSGALATNLVARDVWETDVARFGINVWLAALIATEGLRACQVDVGYRGESGGEPGAPIDARFVHTVGTLFRLVAMYRRLWQQDAQVEIVPVPFWGAPRPDRPVPCRDCIPALLETFHAAEHGYADAWRHVLSPRVLRVMRSVFRAPAEAFDFPLTLWVHVVYEFALNYTKGEGDPDKLIEALLPLFYGRAAAYLRTAQGLPLAARDALLEQSVQAFAQARPLFARQWNDYASWLDTPDYWFS